MNWTFRCISLRAALCAVAALVVPAPVVAQTFGIGTTATGATAQIAATIAKVLSEGGEGLQVRSQTMGGTQQYIPVVNAGELAFGISNIPQFAMAQTGTGLSQGNKYQDLRLITTMMEYSVGFVVTKASGIKSVKDLKGKRLAHGFKAAPLFRVFHEGSLATEGLSYDDVVKVPAVGLPQHWAMFMEGKIDGVIVNAGTGVIKQMNAKLAGGVRHISYDNSAASLAGMHKHFPLSYWKTLSPGKGLDSILEPTTLISYEFSFWTHKGLADDVAYKAAKIMHKHADKLKAAGPLWRTYKSDATLCKSHGYAYHPGAVKYYKTRVFAQACNVHAVARAICRQHHRVCLVAD